MVKHIFYDFFCALYVSIRYAVLQLKYLSMFFTTSVKCEKIKRKKIIWVISYKEKNDDVKYNLYLNIHKYSCFPFFFLFYHMVSLKDPFSYLLKGFHFLNTITMVEFNWD